MRKELQVIIYFKCVLKSQGIIAPSATPVFFEIIGKVVDILTYSVPTNTRFILKFIRESQYFHTIVV